MSDIIKILLQAEVDKSSVENIKSQLSGIQTKVKPIKLNVDSKGISGIKDMTSAFDKLEQVTKKNLSLDLDRLSNRYKNLVRPEDISQIKSMISALEHTDPKLGHNIDLIKVKMKEVSVGAEQSRRSLDLANKSAMSFGEVMKTAAYKFGIWSAITASYFKVIREISTGIKFITEMDTALTEIGMVTNQTREQTAGLAEEYNSLAKEMKVLTSEVTSSAVEFYRQGLSQEEVMERMRVSTMYSKIANLEFTTSAEVLTATVNSMGVDIERVADVFLYMGDSTATSGAEIGKGFQKVGGTASALGMEFEKVASWIAIISSKTRESAESIGTSINTMLSRLSRITQTGFNEDDDTKLNDVAKALNTVGIALTDQTGNFRDFGLIIDEVAVKWDTLDDKTQAYIANTIGGVRQQGRFFNLMDGYAESMELYEESLEAAGTAQEKFNLYLESNQATIDSARTAIESLWITMIDSDSLMNVVKVFTSFIETLDSMVGKFGVIGTSLSFIIPLIGVKLAWSIRSSYIEMLKLNVATGNLAAIPLANAIGGIVKQLFGMEVAAKGATIATGGLTLATAALTAGLTLVPLLIGSIVSAEKKRKQAIEESIEAYNKQKDVSVELDKLTKAYEDLGKETDLTKQQQEELLKVKEKIKNLLPESTSFLDNENLSLAEQVEILKELNTEEKERLRNEAHKQVSRGERAYQRDIKDLENLSALLAAWERQQAVYYKKIQDGSIAPDELMLYNVISNSMEELKEDISETTERIEAYESALSFLNDETDSTIDKTDDLADGMDDLAKATNDADDATQAMAKSVSDLYSEVSNAVDNHEILTQALKELNEEGKISKSTYEKLIEYSEDFAGIMGLEKDEAIRLTNAYIDKERGITQALIKEQESVIETTEAKIAAYEAELMAIDELLRKRNRLAYLDSREGIVFVEGGTRDSGLIDDTNTINDWKSKIDEAKNKISSLKGWSGFFDSSGKSSSTKSAKDQYKAEADRYAKINLELDKNNILMQKNKVLQQNVGDDLAKKLKLMDEEIDLNNQRKKLLHELNEEMRKEARELQESLEKDGFKFKGSWDDNSMVITNLEHIEGKGKDVEERFKRALDIIKTLPNASQEWVDIDFSNIALEIQKVITEFELLHKQFERLDKDLSNLEFGFKLIAEDNIEGQIENITKQVEIFENKLKTAQDELAKLGYVGESSPEHIKKQFEELTKIVQDSTLSIMEFEKKIDSIRESLRVEHIRKLTDAYNEQQESLRKLEQIQENLVAIIRKRGEEEKKALDKAHKAEMDSLEERHKSRKDKYKEELDEFKAMIQAKIDEMDRQNETEDYEENLDKEREKANEIQREIDVLALDTSLTAQNKVSDLRKKLAEQNEKIAKMQQDRERKLLKQSLQDQLKDREKDANDRDTIADNLYDNEKKRLEEEYQIQKEFLEQKYSDASVYAEARQAIIDGQVEYVNGAFMDIGTAFQEFEDNFGKGMGIMGDHIKNDLIANLESAKRLLEETNMLSNMMSKPDSNQSFSDSEIGMPNVQRPSTPSYDNVQGNHSNRENQNLYNELIKNKKEWELLNNKSNKNKSDTGKMSQLNDRNEQIRNQWGINSDDYSYSDLERMSVEDFLRRYGKYAQGGETQRTGLHMLDGRPGKPERVLSAEQTASFNKLVDIIGNSTFQDILKSITMPTAPKVPNISPSQMSSFNIQKLIHIEGNVDEQTLPKLQKAGNDIAETLKNLNKGGVFRPIKM